MIFVVVATLFILRRIILMDGMGHLLSL